MSGQDILTEQLRAEVERLRDDRADLQERCNRLTGERNAALLLMKDEEARAEKAERFIATADSEWKARAEKAERERDEWKAKHDTLADVSRSCIATAERERDAARAEREALRRHYDEAGPEHNLLALLDLYDERRAAAESERDEALRRRTRAERVGEAVIEWASRQTAELIAEYAKALERHDWKPHAELTYAIADALKEADDAE